MRDGANVMKADWQLAVQLSPCMRERITFGSWGCKSTKAANKVSETKTCGHESSSSSINDNTTTADRKLLGRHQ